MRRLLLLGLLIAVSPISAATFTVSSTSDSGPGSLRQAILDANAVSSENPHRIQFAIGGTGVRQIALSSALPAIQRPVVIDGYTQPGAAPSNAETSFNGVLAIELSGTSAIAVGLDLDTNNSTIAGLVINGFGIGVRVRGAENIVRGNFIGTNAAGDEHRPNTTGVLITGANRNLIGGPTTAARNVICANVETGIRITGASSDNRILGNFIGVTRDGLSGLANGKDGIEISSDRNVVGPALAEDAGANVIAYNMRNGITVTGSSVNVFISRNSIFGNGLLGIDLGDDEITLNDDNDADTGPNQLQNYPVLETATRLGSEIALTGRLKSTPNSAFNVEFFGNTGLGGGEETRRDGEVFLGSTVLTTGPGGEIRFDLEVPSREGVSVETFIETVTATATNSSGGTSEFSALVQTSKPGQVRNLSTRLRVESGEEVLIGGFIIAGTDPKKVVVRALGPSLERRGVQDVLADPTIELFRGDTPVAQNDNWRDGDQAEITATGLQPEEDSESAIVRTLEPGAYTAVVRGKNNSTGVGLVELYDVQSGSNSRLANISTRGYVSTDERVMIGGFILEGVAGCCGEGNSKVVIRALGPSLEDRGISDVLQDPELQLVDSSGTPIATNNSWKDDQQSEIEELQLAPGSEDEAVIVATLRSNLYTAIVRSRDGTRGVGLVEVYNIR